MQVKVKLYGFDDQGVYSGRFGDVVEGEIDLEELPHKFEEMSRVGLAAGDAPVISLDLIADPETTLRIFYADGELRWSSNDIELPADESADDAAKAFVEQKVKPTLSANAPHREASSRPLPALLPPSPPPIDDRADASQPSGAPPAKATNQATADEYIARAVPSLGGNSWMEKLISAGSSASKEQTTFDLKRASIVITVVPRLLSALGMGLLALTLIGGAAAVPFALGMNLDQTKLIALIVVGLMFAACGAWIGWIAKRWLAKYTLALDKEQGLLYALVGNSVRAAVLVEELQQVVAVEVDLPVLVRKSKYGPSTTEYIGGESVWLVLKEHARLEVFKMAGRSGAKLAANANRAFRLQPAGGWKKNRRPITVASWDKMYRDGRD